MEAMDTKEQFIFILTVKMWSRIRVISYQFGGQIYRNVRGRLG